MIKYTTNDIVNRAKQLADLENSDFISWNENVNLLNENWQKIYQHLIDNGDKTFIKEFEVNANTSVKLPYDFYELFSVELVPSCFQIHRKAKSETEKSLSYDIVNDDFVLYGYSSEKVRVRYFPTPQTLTLKNKTVDINANMYKENGYHLWDCYKNRYLYSKYDSGNIVNIYNSDSNEVIFTKNLNDTPITNGVMGKKNCFAVSCYQENQTYNMHLKVPNEENIRTISVDTSTQGCLLKSDGDVGVVTIFNNIITLNILNREYVINLNERYNEDDVINEINLDSFGMATFKLYNENQYSVILPIINSETSKCDYVQLDVNIDNDVFFVHESNPFQDYDFGLTTDVDRKNYVDYVDGKLCVATKDYFIIDYTPIFSFDDYALIGVNEINDNNGYGVTVKDVYNTNHIMLHSVFIDTILCYPNNIFYNFISILMAMSYKIKQNADITLLDAKFSDMENQYFDSLSRDVNNVVRITNVY